MFVNDLKFSPLEWTSISWSTGLVLAAPILAFVSTNFDRGTNQQLIAAVATVVGAFFCFPVGIFRVTWIFPLYIIVILIANVVSIASHTRHHGLMVRGFTGPTLHKNQFKVRSSFSSWLSVCATAVGCLGSVVISSFTYHMLRQRDRFMGLWIVSILSGLNWLIGIFHVLTVRLTANTNTSTPPVPIPKLHLFSIFRYYHGIGSLIVITLSSFTSMCIFTAGLLYLVGQFCLKPLHVLYFFLTYFIFPALSVPLIQPLMQHVVKANAIKMQLLGFLLSLATSGVGFYFKGENWNHGLIMFLAALQSTSAGLLHAFGRTLLMDCTPIGEEGVFGSWLAWTRAVGTCAGFIMASVIPGNLRVSFGVAFGAGFLGMILLIFGNISDVGGALAAGHVFEIDETKESMASPVNGLDSSIVLKEGEKEETA